MYIDAEAIITAGKVLGAILAIGAALLVVYKWTQQPKEQAEKIEALEALHKEDVSGIKEENTLICYALAACLDGLMQLGCNHTVPDAKEKLDKYINKKAHE